ncbi:Iron-sulfur cluster-binding protein [Olavius sp. associated proteobacterium Delta 1]|nr:Iron-sulfur cluster-binding protein [Olavius sp. associated proteobacterium Delta 1]
MENSDISKVALVSTEDRKTGVASSIQALGINPVKNKDVLIKPNFNTADDTPGSTHNNTLAALIEEVWQMGAKTVRLGERSYPLTREVMAQKGIIPLLEELEVDIVDFDDLAQKDWVKVDADGSHWRDGFRVARPILESECLISTCCLKTHQFGGVFTLSLKNHVGVVPTTRHGYNYMSELHSSPHQRRLIAEINAPFKPDLVVLDGIEAFVDGGPANGKRADGNVFLASPDRVAIDAVGVAILKSLGSNADVMNKKIFDQEQISRAADLGLGASSPADIDVIAADEKSVEYRDRVAEILKKG